MRYAFFKYWLLNIAILCSVDVFSQTVGNRPQLTKGSIEFIDRVMTDDFIVFKSFQDLHAISANEAYNSYQCYFTDSYGRPNWKPIILKNSAVTKDELLCVEYTETIFYQNVQYVVNIYRYKRLKEEGDVIRNVSVDDLKELDSKLCDNNERLRFMIDDITYMRNWFHSQIPTEKLYYPSTIVLDDGTREINDIKSYGFIIIYTSDDYTPLPTRYRKMIL